MRHKSPGHDPVSGTEVVQGQDQNHSRPQASQDLTMFAEGFFAGMAVVFIVLIAAAVLATAMADYDKWGW